MAEVKKEGMLRHFAEELQNGTAALFLGAGLSVPAGYVNWKTLMSEIADELGLDVNRETDLIAIAQYDVNRRGGRTRINRTLIEEFTKDAKLTENHRLIASLPVRVIWTTNYDNLIESALQAENRRPDTKITPQNLAHSRPHSDAVVYKMHGDISQPHDAVITKDDYETYDDKRTIFSTALKGDLIERTFLFLGFSFTDPNIDYILSRIRALLGNNQRDHYCVMKWPDPPRSTDAKARAEHDYERKKLELRIADLSRYHIHAVMIDSYNEVTDILEELNRRSHYKDIFVSGSADSYEPFGQQRLESLAHRIGGEIVARDFTLVSGFGRGLGGAVTLGGLEQAYAKHLPLERVRLYPFPQAVPDGADKAQLYTAYRKSIISKAGFVIFVAGNKRNETGATVEVANGVLREFDLAVEMGKIPVPIGATGWAAKRIWDVVNGDIGRFYGSSDVRQWLQVLGDESKGDKDYVNAVFGLIGTLSKR